MWDMPEMVADPIASPLDPVNIPLNPDRADLRTRFTPERSRELQAKAQAARTARRESRLLEAQQAQQARLEPVPSPDKNPVKVVLDPYVQMSLTRIREELDNLYIKLRDKHLTPGEIDKIVSSIAKCSVIEQNLAMRPGPGTIKPSESVKTQSRANWLLNTPESESVPVQKQEQE